MSGQDNWKWCCKCGELAFNGHSDLGKCPAGCEHNHKDSWNYVLANNNPSAPGQHHWKWCNKCQALYYGADPNKQGTCPVGGTHSLQDSGDYTLAYNDPKAQGQKNWLWCNKCMVLFYGGFPPGACPAGGVHDSKGSWNYTIPYLSPQTQVAAFLQKYVVSYLSNVPAGHNHYVHFIVSTNDNKGLVSYISPPSTGSLIQLNYDKNTGTLTGDGNQYFSDRMYGDANTGVLRPYPFDPHKMDGVRLILNANDGSATLTLLSWGNAIQPITWHEVDENTMCITGVTAQTAITISFQMIPA